MAFGWALIGIFLPYVFYDNPGYPPRKSIHLLPLALLSIMIVFDAYFRKFYLKNIADKN